MNIVLSICAVIVTIILACLAYSVIRTLKHVNSTLGAANSTLEEAKITIHDLRAEVGQVSRNTNKVIQHTNSITLDVQKKMKDLDILFGSVKEVGTAVHSLTMSIRQSAAGSETKVKQDGGSTGQSDPSNTISAIADGVASSIRIWNRLKQSNRSVQ